MRTLILLLSCGPLLAADLLPMAVWYGGGKARAPMLETNARAKKELWRKDIRQIKALGFNTVRTWVDRGRLRPVVRDARNGMLFAAADVAALN